MVYDAFISYSHSADGKIAPALQQGLQRLARPWYRRRALRVFRDETGLAVNPHLWGSIQAALDESRYFVLLASPQAAASPWVDRELRYWLRTHHADSVLPVLTDGTLRWDERRNDFDPASSAALPAAMFGVYQEEPRFLDVRWARDETDLDLRHSRFRGQVAELASPIHGKPKDELESDDIRQHRRALRLVWTAAFALALLSIAAVVGAVFAVSAAAQARNNERRALAQQHRADTEADLARRRGDQVSAANAELDRANLTLQQTNERLANTNTQLGAQTLLTEDQRKQAVRNAAEAQRNADTAQVNAAAANRNAADAAHQRDVANVNLMTAKSNEIRAVFFADAANMNAARANTNARRAEQQRLAGVARQLVLGSNASLQAGEIDRALLLDVTAERFADRTNGVPGLDVRQPLVDALRQDPALSGYLQGLSGPVGEVAISPDGSRAAAVTAPDISSVTVQQPCAACEIGVWNLANDQALSIFRSSSRVQFVRFVDAHTMIVGGPCNIERLDDSAQGRSWAQRWSFSPTADHCQSGNQITGMAVSPAGTITVAFKSVFTGPSYQAFVLNVQGHVLKTVVISGPVLPPGAPASPVPIGLSPDGSRFAVADGAASNDPASTVGHIYSTSGGAVVSLRPTVGPGTAVVTDLQFSTDGTHLAMLIDGADPPVHRFDVSNGVDDISPPPSGSWSGAVPSSPVAVSPTFDRVVQRYSPQDPSDRCGRLLGVGFIESGAFVGGLDAPIDCTVGALEIKHAVFTPDGDRFVTNGGNGAIPIFISPERAHPPVPTSRQIDAPGCDLGLTDISRRCALAPDGSLLAFISGPRADNSASLEVAPVLPTRRALAVRLPVDAGDPSIGDAQNVAFGDRAEVVAVGFGDGAIELWDTFTGTRVLHLDPPHACSQSFLDNSHNTGCKISMAGTIAHGRIAEASSGVVHIWHIVNGNVIAQNDVVTGDGDATNVALVSSGQRLVVVAESKNALLGGTHVHVYDASGNNWTARLAFSVASEPETWISPDGQHLATQQLASTGVTMYDLNSGTTLWNEPGLGVAGFSADGQNLYAAIPDQNPINDVSLVSTDAGTVHSIIPLSDPLTAPFNFQLGIVGAVETDQHLIIVGHSDALRIFDSPLTPPPNLDDVACQEANRNLSETEWTQFVGSVDAYERTCNTFP